MVSEYTDYSFASIYQENRLYFTVTGLICFFLILLVQRVRHDFNLCHICFIVGAILLFFLQVVCEWPNRPDMDCLLNDQLKMVCIILMIYTVLVFHLYMKKMFSQRTGSLKYPCNIYCLLMGLALLCSTISLGFTFSLSCTSYSKQCVCESDTDPYYNFGKILKMTIGVTFCFCVIFLTLYLEYLYHLFLGEGRQHLHPGIISFIGSRFVWFLFHFIFALTPLYIFSSHSNADYSDFFKLYTFLLWSTLYAATPSYGDIIACERAMPVMRRTPRQLTSILLLESSNNTVEESIWESRKRSSPSRDYSNYSKGGDFLSAASARTEESLGGASFGFVSTVMGGSTCRSDAITSRASSQAGLSHKRVGLSSIGGRCLSTAGSAPPSVATCSSGGDYSNYSKGGGETTTDSEQSLLYGYVRFPDEGYEDVREREQAKARYLHKLSETISMVGPLTETVSTSSTSINVPSAV